MDDIKSLTASEERKKRKQAALNNRKKHRDKYLIPLSNERDIFYNMRTLPRAITERIGGISHEQLMGQYLAAMVNEGTYGDHLTLQAAGNVFMLEMNVYSSHGSSATQTITPIQGCPLALRRGSW